MAPTRAQTGKREGLERATSRSTDVSGSIVAVEGPQIDLILSLLKWVKEFGLVRDPPRLYRSSIYIIFS